jgi:hypothetical protein
MLNLSSLFYTTAGDACLHTALDLKAQQDQAIRAAKIEVRDTLRAGIPRVLKAKGFTITPPNPRFFTQGSWAYKTLNAPAQVPQQQADIDDGCYLPLGFVARQSKPSVAAATFFATAEEALKALVEQRNWKLITDKATCVRVEIASFAHIDIPLYAIPDAEFESLARAAMQHGYGDFAEAVRKAERQAWTALPRNAVLLAHRECDWKESDPRPVKDWIIGEVDARGLQLRRVIRYLKAFRDAQWVKGGPTSLLLMAAAVPLFEKRDGRDDMALADVLTNLPAVLKAGVNNPVDPSESLTKRMTAEQIQNACSRFERLERTLRAALDAGNAAQACEWMRQQFGGRFPDAPERIRTVSVVATVAAAPAAVGPSELVGRTKAG